MQKSYVMTNAVALLAAAACRTPTPIAGSPPERVVGCFRRQYADGPPRSGAGGAWYTLTTDAGATTILDVSPAQLDSAGGPSRLDGSRVSVILAAGGDTSAARTRGARVRAIRREPGGPC
jgi:hypothetical protein